jgi:hypothetical protein
VNTGAGPFIFYLRSKSKVKHWNGVVIHISVFLVVYRIEKFSLPSDGPSDGRGLNLGHQGISPCLIILELLLSGFEMFETLT